MNKTKIEWVKNPDGTPGYTWNPITGCLNGCDYCYARKLANTRLRERYLANTNVAPVTKQEGRQTFRMGFGLKNGYRLVSIEEAKADPFYPRFWEDRLYEPVNKMRRWGRQTRVLHQQSPKGIFVCDMSDLFGIGIPEEWTRRVLDRFQYAPQHRFYLLTKQPQNLTKFSPFPDNCWVGVSATNWLQFSDALGHLATIGAKIKYLSFEPLLEEIKLDMLQKMLFPRVVNWVIIGAQTKPYKPPKIEWVREIVEACDKAGAKVFLKDSLKPLLRQNNHNIYSFPEWAGKQFAVTGDHSLAPTNPHPNEPMRSVRQEVPNG